MYMIEWPSPEELRKAEEREREWKRLIGPNRNCTPDEVRKMSGVREDLAEDVYDARRRG